MFIAWVTHVYNSQIYLVDQPGTYVGEAEETVPSAEEQVLGKLLGRGPSKKPLRTYGAMGGVAPGHTKLGNNGCSGS